MSLSDALNLELAKSRSRLRVDPLDRPQHASPTLQNQCSQESQVADQYLNSRVRPPPSQEGIHAVQKLLRVVAATQEAQETEKKRRLAWEKEQEAKYLQQQTELQGQLNEMRKEIMLLRNYIHTVSVSSTSQHPLPSSAALLEQHIHNMTPSSTLPNAIPHQSFGQSSDQGTLPISLGRDFTSTNALASTSLNFSPPSPHLAHTTHPIHQAFESLPYARKRPSISESDDGESEGQHSGPMVRSKRKTHHDKRCLTIHHAMRLHIMKMMNLSATDPLPDSYVDGDPSDKDQPIRFVWEKTPLQSTHNSRMRLRVVEDIKSHRQLYSDVPDKDFSKKILTSTFDQAFITLRQKFQSQHNISSASREGGHEISKTQKSRKLQRRKKKLNTRAQARLSINVFQHVTFDGALQVDCMSSEESEVENSAMSATVLRTRGQPWRSSRLVNFFNALDYEDEKQNQSRPNRGSKKQRRLGPLKEGFQLPPQGVSTWMISKRWIRATRDTIPDITDVVQRRIVDPPGFDWSVYHDLGVETEDSEEEAQFETVAHSFRQTNNRFSEPSG